MKEVSGPTLPGQSPAVYQSARAARAPGPSGRRRACSQFLSVPSGMPMLRAKTVCDSPVLLRIATTSGEDTSMSCTANPAWSPDRRTSGSGRPTPASALAAGWRAESGVRPAPTTRRASCSSRRCVRTAPSRDLLARPARRSSAVTWSAACRTASRACEVRNLRFLQALQSFGDSSLHEPFIRLVNLGRNFGDLL